MFVRSAESPVSLPDPNLFSQDFEVIYRYTRTLGRVRVRVGQDERQTCSLGR